MQSEVRAPLVQAPIAWVARRLLASDESVQAVMVMQTNGKVLAHERALDCEVDFPDGDHYSLLYHAPGPRLLFYVRLGKQPKGTEILDRIEAILDSPSLVLSP
jgi:hypothetical protein